MNKIPTIQALWDEDASVWVATSEDVPGLVAEAATVEDLSTQLQDLVPQLLRLNFGEQKLHLPFELLARRVSIAHGLQH
jgi:predicted RNase H-like HicB family nuclease